MRGSVRIVFQAEGTASAKATGQCETWRTPVWLGRGDDGEMRSGENEGEQMEAGLADVGLRSE